MNTISGRRKEATAVVRLTKGTGIVTVNKKSIDEYFGRDVAKMIVRQPLVSVSYTHLTLPTTDWV